VVYIDNVMLFILFPFLHISKTISIFEVSIFKEKLLRTKH